VAETGNPICSRLPADLVEILDADASAQGVTRAELIKAILSAHYYGNASTLVGPDNGYIQARRLAPQLAMFALRRALDLLPDDVDLALESIRQMHNGGG